MPECNKLHMKGEPLLSASPKVPSTTLLVACRLCACRLCASRLCASSVCDQDLHMHRHIAAYTGTMPGCCVMHTGESSSPSASTASLSFATTQSISKQQTHSTSLVSCWQFPQVHISKRFDARCSQQHFSHTEIIKQPPYCAFQMQKGRQSLRDKEKLFPSFIIFYTTLKIIKVYPKTSLFARRFEAYQSVFCKRSNVSSSLD